MERPLAAQAAQAAPTESDASLAELARAAVAPGGGDAADRAIERLRAAGPAGLDALFTTFADGAPGGGCKTGPGDTARLHAAMDRVARQRDAYASHLYWYTDLAEAQRAAKASGKPILSLRLLGNLDEELSCANSRFFRTSLYSNAEVSRALRERFVLHWKSERPAPRITIDMGDGRKLERTITGNSIHYVLDSDGTPVDALPGLYGPQAFLRVLGGAAAVAARSAELDLGSRKELIRNYHADRRNALQVEWDGELRKVGGPPSPPPAAVKGKGRAPTARAAAPIAVSKAMAEVPMVQAFQGAVEPLPSPTSDRAWAALIERHAGDARLDASSRALMRAKMGAVAEEVFEQRMLGFERSAAEDTVRNEFTLHRILHEWLSMSPAPDNLETLNARVYATLFLTPRSDPWLGLIPDDSYSAIDGEGIVVSAAR